MLAFSRQVRGPAGEVASHCHARHKAGRNPLGTGLSIDGAQMYSRMRGGSRGSVGVDMIAG